MTTTTNSLGEKITKWDSHKHPDNPDFMQVVKYLHIQYPDGRNNLHWRLANSAANDHHLIGNITLEYAQNKFTDEDEKELTEGDFQSWLLARK